MWNHYSSLWLAVVFAHFAQTAWPWLSLTCQPDFGLWTRHPHSTCFVFARIPCSSQPSFSTWPSYAEAFEVPSVYKMCVWETYLPAFLIFFFWCSFWGVVGWGWFFICLSGGRWDSLGISVFVMHFQGQGFPSRVGRWEQDIARPGILREALTSVC